MSQTYITITAKEWREIGGNTLADCVLDHEKITVLQSEYFEKKGIVPAAEEPAAEEPAE